MRTLIDRLEQSGELVHVNRQVNPKFELAAVTKALQDHTNEAVLFHAVEGSKIPVVSNLYGCHNRLRNMIGAKDGQSFCARWLGLTDACFSATDQTVYETDSKDVSSEFITCKLSDLPAITWHGRDAGPYFTSAIFLANDPDSGVPNLSFHRSMQISDDELRVRLGGPHDLTDYQRRAESRGGHLHAALLLSCPPELFLGACASLPIEASELAMAAQISGKKIAMRKCKTIDLEVPNSVDIVVEGRFLPNEKRPEGPFGEFMGFYVEVDNNHVFEVTHVERRKDAVLHGLLCGSNEDLRPLEAVIAAKVYRHVSSQVRGVIDVSCKPNVMISIIKIDKQYEGHGKHAILSALGSHLDYNKVVIAVDKDVDIYDMDDVMWAYMTRGRADTRAQILQDFPGFYRDEKKDHWGRLTIDATMPWGRETEFQRKAVPGVEDIDLSAYLS